MPSVHACWGFSPHSFHPSSHRRKVPWKFITSTFESHVQEISSRKDFHNSHSTPSMNNKIMLCSSTKPESQCRSSIWRSGEASPDDDGEMGQRLCIGFMDLVRWDFICLLFFRNVLISGCVTSTKIIPHFASGLIWDEGNFDAMRIRVKWVIYLPATHFIAKMLHFRFLNVVGTRQTNQRNFNRFSR